MILQFTEHANGLKRPLYVLASAVVAVVNYKAGQGLASDKWANSIVQFGVGDNCVMHAVEETTEQVLEQWQASLAQESRERNRPIAFGKVARN